MDIRNNEDLIKYLNNGADAEYVFFWGHQKPKKGISKSCFSQWYESPFNYDGKHFETAEHFMMYEKARLFCDDASADKVLSALSAKKAKEIGREVRGFNQGVWEANRFEIVVTANLAKFSANSALRDFLLGTDGKVLVEASPVDRVWGIGLAKDDSRCDDPRKWKGLNLLGYALMEVRKQLS